MLISLHSAFVQPVLSRVAGEVVAWPARDRTKSAKIRYIAPLCICVTYRVLKLVVLRSVVIIFFSYVEDTLPCRGQEPDTPASSH